MVHRAGHWYAQQRLFAAENVGVGGGGGEDLRGWSGRTQLDS